MGISYQTYYGACSITIYVSRLRKHRNKEIQYHCGLRSYGQVALSFKQVSLATRIHSSLLPSNSYLADHVMVTGNITQGAKAKDGSECVHFSSWSLP